MAPKPQSLCSLVRYWIFLFYYCMHYQHAFKWTNSGWTLCVMLCCVCWQLAHHNHHVSLPWLGVLLKWLHTLSLCAHVSFAAVTDSIIEGLLPQRLHLLWPYYIHMLRRVLFAMFPACYLSCCYVFHALLLQGASPGEELHHQVKLYFCLDLPLTWVFPAELWWWWGQISG